MDAPIPRWPSPPPLLPVLLLDRLELALTPVLPGRPALTATPFHSPVLAPAFVAKLEELLHPLNHPNARLSFGVGG